MPQGVRVRVSPPAQIHFHLNLDEFISAEIKNEVDELSFSWESPSNIALVKYWGKFSNQTPKNPSISFTLSNCKTTTNVIFKRLPKSNDLVAFDFYFENQRCAKSWAKAMFLYLSFCCLHPRKNPESNFVFFV